MNIMNAIDIDRRQTDVASRQYFLNAPFDQIDQAAVLDLAAGADPNSRFRYIVTPNADHVVRLNREPSLRPYYEDAWLTLCDSKPISLFAHARSREMTHVTGSDLTVSLFRTVIQKADRITLIVGNREIGEAVRAAYPGVDFRIHVPPFGLLKNLEAQRECVEFALRGKASFIFIAVGSPQSEKIAHMLSKESSATGIGLCVGASLEFLVGAKTRAPMWMQRLSLEWLHRLITDPKRLWRRYVFGAWPLIMLFSREIMGHHSNAKIFRASPHR